MASSHTDSTNDQCWLPSPLVDVHNRWDCGDEHDNTDDTCSQQTDSSGVQTQLSENGRRIVQHSVDTGPLLEEHSSRRYNHTLKHSLALEQAADSNKLQLRDACSAHVLEMREILLEGLLLEQRLGFDFGVFKLNEIMVLR